MQVRVFFRRSPNVSSFLLLGDPGTRQQVWTDPRPGEQPLPPQRRPHVGREFQLPRAFLPSLQGLTDPTPPLPQPRW